MTIHYHGTPITPVDKLYALAGLHFCVSFADPRQMHLCHEIGQSVMADNGEFTRWMQGKPTNWPGFYTWVDPFLDYPTTWAVIPDVIDGGEEDNDVLIKQWPFGFKGAPVWHLHERIDRLLRLADEWPLVCFGSSGEYAVVGSDDWHRRAEEAFEALSSRHWRTKPVHMLRGLSLAGSRYPFFSMDSTNVARNHAGSAKASKKDPRRMADTIDAKQCAGRWWPRELREQIWAEHIFGEEE